MRVAPIWRIEKNAAAGNWKKLNEQTRRCLSTIDRVNAYASYICRE
jgi:hypothetical protein